MDILNVYFEHIYYCSFRNYNKFTLDVKYVEYICSAQYLNTQNINFRFLDFFMVV